MAGFQRKICISFEPSFQLCKDASLLFILAFEKLFLEKLRKLRAVCFIIPWAFK